MSTGITCIDVTAQTSRPARGDPVDNRTLLPAPGQTPTLGLTSQVPLEDLRDLVPRSLGHLLGADELRS